MATKKSTPAKKAVSAKKAVPAKKLSKPAAKTSTKTVAKSAIKTSSKIVAAKVATKKVVPAKKDVAKTTPKKVAPAKAVTKPAKAVEKKVKTLPVKVGKKIAKVVPKKEHSSKPLVVPKLSTKSAVKYQPDFSKSILDINKNEKAKAVIRYSDSDLQEFKEIILKKLDAAKKELTYLQGLITRRDEDGDMDEGRYMTMEDGSVSMEREQLSQFASRQIQFIDHLEKALMRVENKTYGICRSTGNLIDKARLRAVPHATLSMEAKITMNK